MRRMKVKDADILIVPGYTNSGPDHWQTRWQAKLSTAQVIDVSTLSGDKVVFGATVELSDVDTGEERVVTIVGEDEADVEKGLISFSSPMARALIGKQVDDTARVKLPSGEKEWEIREVRFGR